MRCSACRLLAVFRLPNLVEWLTFLTFRGPDLTLDGYRSRYSTTGLLIARGETILVERYQYGRP